MTRDEIQRSGVTTTLELLALLPEIFGGGPAPQGRRFGNDALSNPGFGASANLFAQGVNATLILVDGHRIAASGDGARFSDISNIPLQSIERVELLAEGASAIYGADAVGGVLNFVLLDGSRPPETVVQAGVAPGGNFNESHLSQSIGTVWLAQQPLAGRAELSIQQDTESRLPPGPTAFADPYRVDLLPLQKLDTAFVHVEQSFSPDSSLATNVLFSHRFASQHFLDFPESEQFQRNTTVVVQTLHLSADFATRLGANQKLSVSISRAVETERQRTMDPQAAAAEPASSSNPFNAFSRIDEARAKLDGLLTILPGRDIQAGIGGEYRRQVFAPSYGNDDPGIRLQYEREIWAAFTQLTFPILDDRASLPGVQSLNLGAAARYEHYSDFGHYTAPQLALTWVPARGFGIRVTWARSFQAPSLVDLDESKNSTVVATVGDHQSPSGTSDVLVISGNRSTLTQETATSRLVSAGFTVLAAGPFSFSAVLNYFDFSFRGRVDAPDLSAVTLDDDRYQSIITRNPDRALQRQLCSSGQFYGNVASCLADGFAAVVDVRLRNEGALLTRGVAFRGTGTYRPEWGAVNADLYGTYLLKYRQTTPGAPEPVSSLNTLYSPLRLQMHGRLGFDLGPVELAATINFTNKYHDDLSDPPRPIASWTTVDTQLTYRPRVRSDSWLVGTSVSVFVRNAFDHGPPAVRAHLENQNYDAENAFPLGTMVRLELRKSWGARE